MRNLFSKIKYLFFGLFLLNFVMILAEPSSPHKKFNDKSQILIESNTQRSDFENSTFYAEGDVKITNSNDDFYAKSNKAIFYKSDGIIKLIGNAEVITNGLNKINAGEILYYLEENKFEAVSDSDQRVNTKFIFNDEKTSN